MALDIGEWLEGSASVDTRKCLPTTRSIYTLCLGRYVEVFADNEIDLHALPHITEEDLKEIGVALGGRRKLLAAIAELGDSDRPATGNEMSDERSRGGVSGGARLLVGRR